MYYLKWDTFETTLHDKRILYFSLYDLERIFSVQRTSLKQFLSRNARAGKLIRLKRNLYCLARNIPGEYLLANILYQPSYLSLEFALSYYAIIPETVYSITSVTTKPTREFTVTGRVFSYQTIKKAAFCGYTPRELDNKSIFIATPEKALADYLYFVLRGTKTINDRTDWKKVDKKGVASYLMNAFHIQHNTVKNLLP